MLTYHVQYADRSSGGVCESYTVADVDGVRTVSIGHMQFGRVMPMSQTTGRWSFYAAGACLQTFDLDAPSRRQQIGQSAANKANANWMA